MSSGTLLVVHVPSESYAFDLMKHLMNNRLPFVVSSQLEDVTNFAKSKLQTMDFSNSDSREGNGMMGYSNTSPKKSEAYPSNQLGLPSASLTSTTKPIRKRKTVYFEESASELQYSSGPPDTKRVPTLLETEKLIKEEVTDEITGTSNGFEAYGQSIGIRESNDLSMSYTQSFQSTSSLPPSTQILYPAIGVRARNGVHPVMLYKFIVVDGTTGAESEMCYAFALNKRDKTCDKYTCSYCKQLRRGTSIGVRDGGFLKNPMTLGHVCQPVPYAQESARRLMYAKLQQVRAGDGGDVEKPKQIFLDLLEEIQSDPSKGPEEKANIGKALGPYSKHRRSITNALYGSRKRVSTPLEDEMADEAYLDGQIDAEDILGEED